jgi:perosamine synthetase
VSRLAAPPRLRLDAGLGDALAGIAACATARSAAREERRLLEQWGLPTEGVACLSVRSAFDLLLTGLRLPAGAEVAFTAITHPDMAVVARAHGARVVSLDLDADTLAPTPAALAAISPATRVVVVAHLFGGRVDLEALVRRTRSHGALLVEDCAQALRGPSDRGDVRADVSLFSFGAIKTATAFGGALIRIHDAALLAAVRDAQALLQRQSRPAQLARVLKFSGLVLVGRPLPYGLLLRGLALSGRDPDVFVNGLVKAFPRQSAVDDGRTADDATTQLLRRIRRAPSAPLLALMRRRLRRFDHDRLARRAAYGARASAALPAALRQPGRLALDPTHWVFPVLAADPDALVRALRSEGVDAARGTSSIDAITASGRGTQPYQARELMAHIVFVPVYPELGEAGLARHLDALRRAAAAQPSQLGAPTVVPA